MKNFAEKAAVLTFTISSLIGAEAKATHHELATLGDAVANNKTNEIKAKTNKVITTQAYDATADFKNPPKTFVGASAKFSKSREKNNKWVDPAEIKKRKKDAQRVIKLLGGLEGAELDAKAKADGITIKYLTDLIEKLEEVRQQYDKFVSRGGSEATEEDDIANSNGEKKFSDIQDQVYDIIIKLKKYRAQKEIKKEYAEAVANGAVTNYKEIPANSKLAEMIKKMQITFENGTRDRVYVFVNGKRAFVLIDPKNDKSYKMMASNNVFFIEVLGINDKTYIAEFKFTSKKVIKLRGNKLEELKQSNSFELSSDKNPAKKEVSMSH